MGGCSVNNYCRSRCRPALDEMSESINAVSIEIAANSVPSLCPTGRGTRGLLTVKKQSQENCFRDLRTDLFLVTGYARCSTLARIFPMIPTRLAKEALTQVFNDPSLSRVDFLTLCEVFGGSRDVGASRGAGRSDRRFAGLPPWLLGRSRGIASFSLGVVLKKL